MEIRVENGMEIRVENSDEVALLGSYREPTAGTGGVGFPAMPRLRRFAVSSVLVFGTVSFRGQPPNLKAFECCTIVIPTVGEDEGNEGMTLAEEYAKLREEIVASGLPMLADEELRSEIRDRRGLKRETET